VQVHVIDRATYAPVLTAAAVLREISAANPGRFAWRNPPYEYEHDKEPIDILAGTSTFRAGIERGDDPRAMAASWAPGVEAFGPLRRGSLLYR
jgi:uncharacterized protein YbbC (DUF1343 family)